MCWIYCNKWFRKLKVKMYHKPHYLIYLFTEKLPVTHWGTLGHWTYIWILVFRSGSKS